MKCKNCKYLGNDTFENTTLKTCKMAYYLIKKYQKECGNGGKSHAYTTTALTSEEDTCMFEYTILTFDD